MDPSAHTTTFHRFPHLPPELRYAIWTLAPEPRIIHLREGPEKDLANDNQPNAARPAETEADNPEDSDDEPEWWFQVGAVPEHALPAYIVSSGPRPPILYACAESRLIAIARRLYEPAFAYPWSPRYTWINFDLDTVQMEQTSMWVLPPADRSRIRRAIFDATYSTGAWGFVDDILGRACHMDDMKALKDLRVLTEESFEEWQGPFVSFRLHFEMLFGAEEGWIPPKMTVTQTTTGETMDERRCLRAFQPPSRGGTYRGGGRGHSGR